MTMATTEHRSEARSTKPLRKQPEIEETEEQESSPGSDQSDATITADRECLQQQGGGGGTPEVEGNKSSMPVEDVPSHNHNTQVHPKVKQLTRGIAIEDMSPPPEHTLGITHSTSLDSGTNGLFYKSPKAILEKSGSQSSEAGTSSSLSRDSSLDKGMYKDSTGINLEDFIRKTMNKTPKDRNMLLKLETDLTNFINEPKHHFLRFPQMSSYDRMLVHRIAAFFGLDHNVDQTGKCVIVNKTSNTRIPEFCFREHIDTGEPKKKITGIMRRIGISSLDEGELSAAQSDSKSLDKPLLLTAKARSFEERIKDYQKARSKIFSEEGLDDDLPVPRIISKKPNRPCSLTKSNNEGQPWSSTDSSGYGTDSSVSKTRGGSVQKAKSFGGTVSYNHQTLKFPTKSHSLSAEPSVSPSHSGISSPMGPRHQLPAAPTPPGSHSDSSPLSRSSSSGPIQSPGFVPNQGNQVYWVASDIRTIPPGSMLINPNTGQPLSNPDGSVYHHQPGQPPPTATQNVYSTPQYSSDMWTAGNESTATAELCRHLSMVNMGPHSIEVGEPPGPQGAPQVQGGTPYLVQGAQQQMQAPIQQSPVVQTQYFPGQQSLPGGVRYMYPVNYGVQNQTPTAVQGQGHGTMIAIDNQTFSQNNSQYPPQGNYQGFPTGAGGAAAAAPNVEQYQTSTNVSQNTYPVIPQGEGGVQHFTSYPVQYSSNSSYPTPQTTVFYSSVPTSAAAPVTGAGYSYGVGQHNPYHSATPPSQGSATLTNQTVALHNLGQGQPMSIGPGGITAPTAGAPGGAQQQTPTNPQFMYSTVPQFTGVGQPRAANPQLVQYHSVPAAQTASTPTQAVPIIRNMQLNMQIPAQMTALQQQQQQQQHLQGGLTIGQPGPLSVGVKGCYQIDNPKLETAGENKDYVFGGVTTLGSNMVAGPPRPAAPIIRPPAPITQDVRLLGQTSYRPPLQVPFPAQVIPQQPQKTRITGGLTGASIKPQRLKKSRSKESTDSSVQSLDSTESQPGSVLEVCDMPGNMKRSEAESWLKDLVSVGAKVQFIPIDSSQSDHPHVTISSFRKILAIFPTVAAATKALHSQENCPFKLRFSTTPVIGENIGVKS